MTTRELIWLCLLLLFSCIESQSLYDILGVSRDATESQLKRAYRKLSRELHPDSSNNSPSTKEKYLEVQKAYDILKDPEKRKQYDITGKSEPQGDATEQAVRSFDNTCVEPLSPEQFNNVLSSSLPNIVLFWAAHMSPQSLEAVKEFKRIASHFRGIFTFYHVQCERSYLCQQMGMQPPVVARLQSGQLERRDGEINSYTLREWLISLISKLLGRHKHKLDPLTPQLFPPKICYQFVAFQLHPCEDCQHELLIALGRLYSLEGGPAPIYDFQFGKVDCEKYPNLCEKYNVTADKEGAWRVAAICPDSVSIHMSVEGFVEDGPQSIHVDWMTDKHEAPYYMTFLQSQVNGLAVDITSFDDYQRTIINSEDAWIVAYIPPDLSWSDMDDDYSLDVEIVARMSSSLILSQGALKVGRVRCQFLRDVCNMAGVNGREIKYIIYPYTKNGKLAPFVYEGKITPHSIINVAKKESIPSPLVQLTDSNWDQHIVSPGVDWLVLFSAGSWCPPCTEIKPIFRQAARILEYYQTEVRIGSVDCDRFGSLCQRQGIKNYPTVMALINSKQPPYTQTYDGPRTSESISHFALTTVRNAINEAELKTKKLTPDNWHKFKRSRKDWIVLFSAGSWCPPCNTMRPFFNLASKSLEPHSKEIKVGYVDCDMYRQICDQEGISGYPSLQVYINSKDWKVKIPFKGEPGADAIREFALETVRSNSFPLSSSNWDSSVTHTQTDWLVLFSAGAWCPPCIQIKPIYQRASELLQPHQKTIRVGVVDCDVEGHLCQSLGLQSYPAIILFVQSQGSPFNVPFEGHRSPQEIVSFALDTLKSMSKTTALPIESLHPNNFYNIQEGRENWLVLFSAGQWCPPCVRLKPIFTSSSRLLGSFGGKLKMAMIDCDLYGYLCGQSGITGYPTLRLYIKGQSPPVSHNFGGAQTAVAIKQFVEENINRMDVSLTVHNWNSVLAQTREPWLVLFNAGEWCPPCTQIKPIYATVALKISNKMKVGVVNCDVEAPLCHQQGVQGYPEVRVYLHKPDGSKDIHKYSGPRTANGIATYIINYNKS